MIALGMYGFPSLGLPSHSPFPVFPHLIAIGAYGVGRIRIRIVVSGVIVAEMHILHDVFVMLLDCLPTVYWS